jgi:hypothetical protein
MIFGLLATEAPARATVCSAQPRLSPLYAAGIIGPAAGALVASVSGVRGLFVAASSVFLFGAVMIYLARSRRTTGAVDHPPAPVEF